MKKLKCLIFFCHKFPEISTFFISTIVLKEKVIPLILSIVVVTFFGAISVYVADFSVFAAKTYFFLRV